MRIYFVVTGVFCLLYYLLICNFTGRWNSTFAFFWPIAGGLHLVPGFFPLTGIFRIILHSAIAIFWVIFLVTEALICSRMLRYTKKDVSYIIVLGAQVRGTIITNSLLRRLDAALAYLKKHPKTKAVVSGGKGKGEAISEAEAMYQYLTQHGIEEGRILQEDKSTSTWENLKYSGCLIKDMKQPVAVVTNNFHIYRALLIGKRAGFQDLHGIPASSNPILQLNYLVREFFAVLWLGTCLTIKFFK